MCCLCSTGCEWRVLFAGGVSEALEVLEVQEGMRRVLLCVLEAVEGELCLLEVPEVMRRVLLCVLEAVVGGFYLPEVCRRCWRCRRQCALCCFVCWRP